MLHELTLTEAAAQVRTGQVSPVDLVRAMLDRIERLDGTLTSFITVTAEAALAEAQRAEAQAALGGALGPLHGVPIALKDLFDTAGVRTTGGSKILADRVPDADAGVVARLRQAGAIVLGKLNMHEFAFGVTTDNPHFGRCNNPWNVGHTPGGSSGGSGAAVAAALCYASLGSDTGGSIRIPASYCGVVGLKPTYGRVGRGGVLPLAWSLDNAGPMTKTVRDTALLLNVIAGYDDRDPASANTPVPDYLADLDGGVRSLRIGVPRAWFFERAEPDVAGAVEAALDLFRAEGAEVRDVTIPDFDLAAPAFQVILLAEAAAYHQRRLRDHAADFGPDVRARLTQGELYAATEYLTAQRLRRRVVAGFTAALNDVDLLVTPTTPTTAPAWPGPPVETPNPATRCTFPINVCSLPALSVPCGFDGRGLPVGLQIIGRAFDEATVLRAGHAYERATAWRDRRPSVF